MNRYALTCVVLAMCAARVPAGCLVTFRTPVGEMQFELFDEDKPVTVRNFLRYVQSGRYRDGFIERWNPGFVIQGGGMTITNRATRPAAAAVAAFPAIVNEYDVGRTFSNVYGTIAMARRGGVTNSATSSWFINLGDNRALDAVDGGFTVFGRLVRGREVLDAFTSLPAAAARGMAWVNPNPFHIDLLPVYTRDAVVTYDDLIYVDVVPLSVGIGPRAGGGAVVRWNSASNAVNRVQYRVAPAVGAWATLLATNGTGAAMQAVDADPAASGRVYRVVVGD